MTTYTFPRRWGSIILLFLLLSCSNSDQGRSISSGPINSAKGQSIPSENSRDPASSENSSGSKGKATAPTEISSSSNSTAIGSNYPDTSTTSIEPGQPNSTPTPTIPPAPSTVAPRFLPFKCSVAARDYSGSTPKGGQAIEVLVEAQGSTTGGVWAEATSKNFRKRFGLKLETNGSGRTVIVAPDEYVVQVKIYAASTLEPSSLMCQTSN